MEVVADRPYDQATLLIYQEGALLRPGRVLDCLPKLQQVVQIPLELFDRPPDAGSAANDAHASGDRQTVHIVAQLVPVFALDAARNATTAGVVGHENEIAPGQADEGGQRGALVAALVFFHLNDQFLAFLERILNTAAPGVNAGLEKRPRHFLEGKESVPLGAVIDKRSLEAGLDAGDDTLVDVAFSLFLGGRFDVKVNQFLTIDYRDPEFLGLGRIEKHALHCIVSRARGQDKPLAYVIQAAIALSGSLSRERKWIGLSWAVP